MFERVENWLDLVSFTKTEAYILTKFPNARDIRIRINEDKSYSVSFYNWEDEIKEQQVVILTPFTTSLEGEEFDEEWVSLVLNCNKGRKIKGLSFEEDLVNSLEAIIYKRKIDAFKKANTEYKANVKTVNKLFKNLEIEEEIEPIQY